MKIVVLDGYTLNPGDFTWESLESLGTLDVYDRTSPDQTLSRVQSADALLTNKVVLSAEILDKLPDLKYIGVTATGFNIVDIEAAKRRGIRVTNVPAYSTNSVAQLVFAFILEHCHHVGMHSDAVRSGRWSQSKDFAFWDRPLIELDGLCLGIIGFGNIGRQVAKIGQAFGMNVIVHTRSKSDTPDVEFGSLDDVLRQADFLTLHCPLTDQTKGLINAHSIELMKRSAFLINTGRGPLVEDSDLARALNEGRLAGAGLDVLSVEPPPEGNPLLSADNAFITPHIAWATKSARGRLFDMAVSNFAAWMNGRSQNVVA